MSIGITFLEHFQALEDPRQVIKVWYPLDEILLLCLCAVICGAETFVDIADYGQNKLDFLRTLLPFKNGIPSHHTIGEVLSRLDPDAFQIAFANWVRSLQKDLPQIVAIDGKTLRHSFNGGCPATHMVSAWACDQHLVLGQEKVDTKSNEITAIPELLKLLMLKGAIVTIDAMGCQRTIVEKILEKGADYVISLKGNQGMLYQDIQEFFQHQRKEGFRHSRVDMFKTIEKGHGRLEERCYWSCDDVEWLEAHHQWPGLKSISVVQSRRTVGEYVQEETRYHISSLPMNAQKAAEAIRSHWQVENKLHWVLDVVFSDDQCRVRTDDSPQNFHVLKQMAVNLSGQVHTKISMRRKRKQAGWNDQFLLDILNGS
jgi:predicted transposase YbfD/YdcC